MTFKHIVYVGRRPVSQSPSGWGDVIMGVEQNGDLRRYCYFGNGEEDVTGATGWLQNSGNRIGNGFHSFVHLVGLDDGILLGVEPGELNGHLRWYRYIGNGEEDVSGGTGWVSNSRKIIGRGWHGFKNIFAYHDDVSDELGAHQIFGVEQEGHLRWYGYKGNGEEDESGAAGFLPNSRNIIGRGWQSFRHLVAGGGVIFSVDETENSYLRWYRYFGKGQEDESGATGWASNSSHRIGRGWGSFRQMFVGAHPRGLGGWTLYAVDQNGDLRWYHYQGHGEEDESGATGFHPNSGNRIGNGW